LYLAVLHTQPKIVALVKNWREGIPIMASHDDDDDTTDEDDDTGTSEDVGSDEESSDSDE
jgi:hypothetical protein